MVAPSRPGNYDYVCTYPEHWKNMFGTLVVVKDMDAFLKEAAQDAPKKQALLRNGINDPWCISIPGLIRGNADSKPLALR